jgi:hypothetical protein
MDGDGHPDIVGLAQIFYGNNGAYSFAPVALPSAANGPFVIGDFNGRVAPFSVAV